MKQTILSENIYIDLKKGIKEAGVKLPDDVKKALNNALNNETGPGEKVLRHIKENLNIAEEENMPMCQDTGMVIVFLEIGDQVNIEGDHINDVIYKAVEDGYKEAFFRKSVVEDPLNGRKNSGNNLPPIIYHEITKGSDLKISLMMKGFGSENCSRIEMLKPTSSREDVIDTVCKIVQSAGASPCPPSIIGIGIGGTMDYAARLSKKALLRDLDDSNSDPYYEKLENDIYNKINSLGIGGGGMGGEITTLGVKVEKYPTHIAGLPVAVSINCWADRKTIIEYKGDK